jgi:transposase
LRLCAIRKSRLATEAARKKAREKAKKKGNEIQPETLEYAEYVMVLCSADWRFVSMESALDLYRGRWQVELVFKRLKSLLQAGHVPKESDASARAWMQAKILSALLIERTLWEGEFLSPWGHGFGRRRTSESLAIVY